MRKKRLLSKKNKRSKRIKTKNLKTKINLDNKKSINNACSTETDGQGLLINLSRYYNSISLAVNRVDNDQSDQTATVRINKKKKGVDKKHFNCGRWSTEEHQRFIEAIIKYGNEWKKIQNYIGTRTSSQARSHAQKFFIKFKKKNIFDLNIDISKSTSAGTNYVKSINEIAQTINSEEYLKTLKNLNLIAFERKSHTSTKLSCNTTNCDTESNKSRNLCYMNDQTQHKNSQ